MKYIKYLFVCLAVMAVILPAKAVNFTFDVRGEYRAKVVIDDKEAKIYLSGGNSSSLKLIGSVPSWRIDYETTIEEGLPYYYVGIGEDIPLQQIMNEKLAVASLNFYDGAAVISVTYGTGSENIYAYAGEESSENSEFFREMKRLIDFLDKGGFKKPDTRPAAPSKPAAPATPVAPPKPADAQYKFKEVKIQKGLVVNGYPSIQVDASCDIRNCAGKNLRFELYFFDMNGRSIITDGDATDPQGLKYFRSPLIDGSAASRTISHWWKVYKNRLAIPAGAKQIKLEVRLVDEDRDRVMCSSFNRIVNLDTNTPDVYHISN